MAGTKRLAITGPWHGQAIEPTTDEYESITWRAEGAAALAIDAPVPVVYRPATYPIPTMHGLAPMPVLIPEGIDPTPPEVVDALVMAVFGQVSE